MYIKIYASNNRPRSNNHDTMKNNGSHPSVESQFGTKAPRVELAGRFPQILHCPVSVELWLAAILFFLDKDGMTTFERSWCNPWYSMIFYDPHDYVYMCIIYDDGFYCINHPLVHTSNDAHKKPLPRHHQFHRSTWHWDWTCCCYMNGTLNLLMEEIRLTTWDVQNPCKECDKHR